MNLLHRVENLEKTYGDTEGMRLPADFALTSEEHAAFCLSTMPLFASYDVEYSAKAGLFMHLYGKSRKPRQTDPAEMMRAMRNTVRGDDVEKTAERQRYRSLMDSAFQRCDFNLTAAR